MTSLLVSHTTSSWLDIICTQTDSAATHTYLPVLLSLPELTSFLEGGRGRPGNGRDGVEWLVVLLPVLTFHVSNTSRSSAVRLPSDGVVLPHDRGVCPTTQHTQIWLWPITHLHSSTVVCGPYVYRTTSVHKGHLVRSQNGLNRVVMSYKQLIRGDRS